MKAGQEMKDGKVYGCHVDLSDDENPDGCVLDYDAPQECIYGKLPSGRDRKSKWTCPHWKPVKASNAVTASGERITYTDGELDEIVGAGGAHLERTGNRHWFLEIKNQDGSSVALWFTSDDLHKPQLEIRDLKVEP